MQNYKLNGIKRKLSILTVAFTFMLALCHASEFPLAGGNIASSEADGWNGAKPGSGEEAKFIQPGTYTASDNVTFGSVNFATDGLVFDLSSGNRAVTLDGATPVVGPTIANATTHLKGGSWNGKDITFQKIGDGYTLRLTDGASIADAGTLSLGHGLINNSVVLDGESEIHANTILLHRWGNTGTKLDVGGGSKVYVTGAFMVQQNGERDIYFAGNHFVDVHDVDSLLQIGADLNLGQFNSHNVVRIRDGAIMLVPNTGVKMAGDGRHLLEVLNGATATVKKTEITTIGNRIVVSNATYKVSEGISLGNAATVTGNVMTVTGPEAVFNCTNDVFGAGCGNVFELANGASWNIGGIDKELIYMSSNNVLRVTGDAIIDNTGSVAGNSRLRIGGYWNISGNNTLEILDGATFRVEALSVAGVGSRIVVSNATLQAIASDGSGIWLGHGYNKDRGSQDCLIVSGTTPTVRISEYKSSNGSTICFEVPEAGYAEGHVPVTATKLDSNLNTSTEKFEIDCDAWVVNPNAVRKLVLMRTTTNIKLAQAEWILSQNADLPETVRLKVTDNEVILQKRVGFVISFR